MRLAVVDGQGGGIGKMVVEKIRQCFGDSVEILALGTNALATAAMLKAGAHEGATGENAIRFNAGKVSLIIGTIGIIAANAMMGELTPEMAKAIADSPAKKVMIPLNRCNLIVVGTRNEPLLHYIDEVLEIIRLEVK